MLSFYNRGGTINISFCSYLKQKKETYPKTIKIPTFIPWQNLFPPMTTFASAPSAEQIYFRAAIFLRLILIPDDFLCPAPTNVSNFSASPPDSVAPFHPLRRFLFSTAFSASFHFEFRDRFLPSRSRFVSNSRFGGDSSDEERQISANECNCFGAAPPRPLRNQNRNSYRSGGKVNNVKTAGWSVTDSDGEKRGK